ncbi:MAG: hypothetical protein NVSMB48_03540 [Marmoricola sp.]
MSVGLLVPAADAVTSPVVSYKGLPSGWDGASINCSAMTEGSPTVSHVTGPGTPPLGSGSLKISESNSSTILELPFLTSPALSSLTAFDAGVYEPATGGLTPTIDIGVTQGSTHYLLVAPGSGTGAWQTIDTTTATMGWVNADTDTAVGSGTLAQFETAYPGALLGALLVVPGASCRTGSFSLDAFHYNVNGTESTTDFEAPYADSFVNHTSSRSVLTGTPVTLSATLSSTAQPFSTGQTVQLWAKSATSSTYKLLKTLTTDPTTGAVSYRVGPSSSTSYQWRYPASNAGNNYAPVNSSVTTIVTRQRVAITSKPTTTSYRGYATIKGRLTPAKSGVVVRLVREVSGRRIVVASARSTTGGYFTLKAPMLARGTYTYVVTASAYTGEAAGQSASFRITTR